MKSITRDHNFEERVNHVIVEKKHVYFATENGRYSRLLIEKTRKGDHSNLLEAINKIEEGDDRQWSIVEYYAMFAEYSKYQPFK